MAPVGESGSAGKSRGGSADISGSRARSGGVAEPAGGWIDC